MRLAQGFLLYMAEQPCDGNTFLITIKILHEEEKHLHVLTVKKVCAPFGCQISFVM